LRLPLSLPLFPYTTLFRSGQSLGVVGVLVASKAAVDRLAEEIRQRKLPIVSGARISEVPFDEGVKAETFVQLAREQQPSIGGDRDRKSTRLNSSHVSISYA